MDDYDDEEGGKTKKGVVLPFPPIMKEGEPSEGVTNAPQDRPPEKQKRNRPPLELITLRAQLLNWILADFGTNDIKRAQLIKELRDSKCTEERAQILTRLPDFFSEEMIDGFILHRQRAIEHRGHRDRYADDFIIEKLRALAETYSACAAEHHGHDNDEGGNDDEPPPPEPAA